MGKKRKRTKKISKGIHSSIAKGTIQLSYPDAGQRLMNKLRAWKKGQNPWVTVFDVNASADRQHRRLRSNDVWGDPRRTYNIYSPKKDREEQQSA